MKIYISFLLFVNSALGFYGSEFDYPGVEIDIADRFGRPRPHILALRESENILTQTQAEAGYAATCGAVNSAIGLPAVQADINNVTVNSIAIEAEFRSVLAQLTAIDSRNLSTQKFAPGWNALYDQWTDILWTSRNTASDTVAYAQNFVDTVMPFVANTSGSSCPPALGIQVLQGYITEARGLQDNAQLTAQNFTNLQISLSIFTASFQDFAGQEGQTASSNITTLQNDVDGLVARIAVLNDEIIGVGIALGISIFGEVSMIALLPVAGPYAIGLGIAALINAGAIIAESVALAVFLSQRSDLETQKDNDTFQISQLQKTLAQIASANQILGSISQQTVPTMITQLNAFNNVWDAVVGDCQAVIAYLNQLTSPTNQLIPQMFWSTANHVPCIYEVLIPALNSYAAGIDSSNIPPPSIAVRPAALDHVQFRASIKEMVGQAKLKAASISELEL